MPNTWNDKIRMPIHASHARNNSHPKSRIHGPRLSPFENACQAARKYHAIRIPTVTPNAIAATLMWLSSCTNLDTYAYNWAAQSVIPRIGLWWHPTVAAASQRSHPSVLSGSDIFGT